MKNQFPKRRKICLENTINPNLPAVQKGNPSKQGLKQIDLTILPLEQQGVQKGNPSKQGLKRYSLALPFCRQLVQKGNPSKQGLKQALSEGINPFTLSKKVIHQNKD